MTKYESIAVIISVIACVSTILNIICYYVLTKKYNRLVEEQNLISKKQNQISEEQNKISQGQAETQIRELIMSARREVQFQCEKYMRGKTNHESNEMMNIYEGLFSAAEEDLRNAYEEACSRYLDGKIDKERFRRMYYTEIQNLVENKDQIQAFDTLKSRYRCIKKVYDEWFNLEK